MMTNSLEASPKRQAAAATVKQPQIQEEFTMMREKSNFRSNYMRMFAGVPALSVPEIVELSTSMVKRKMISPISPSHAQVKRDLSKKRRTIISDHSFA